MVWDYFDKYTFVTEMYDEDADDIVELTLNFFPFDNSVQVINAKKGKNLLRRVHLPSLNFPMLKIGNIVNVFSKLLLITDCAPATRRTLFNKVESTFALIKPVPPSDHGKIITFIMKNGFNIVRMKNGKMLDMFFGYENGVPKVPYRATFKNCTCCIIKPHAVIDGNVGSILEQIAVSGIFYISAMAMFSVKLSNAEEFYEVYKGVVPEYEAMCIQLAEGKCIALEVKCTDSGKNCVCEFRKLCGPRDPDLCRQLYPDSIRAQYGKTIVLNAVHCTDLPEDGEAEVEYFFKLLAMD